MSSNLISIAGVPYVGQTRCSIVGIVSCWVEVFRLQPEITYLPCICITLFSKRRLKCVTIAQTSCKSQLIATAMQVYRVICSPVKFSNFWGWKGETIKSAVFSQMQQVYRFHRGQEESRQAPGPWIHKTSHYELLHYHTLWNQIVTESMILILQPFLSADQKQIKSTWIHNPLQDILFHTCSTRNSTEGTLFLVDLYNSLNLPISTQESEI